MPKDVDFVGGRAFENLVFGVYRKHLLQFMEFEIENACLLGEITPLNFTLFKYRYQEIIDMLTKKFEMSEKDICELISKY